MAERPLRRRMRLHTIAVVVRDDKKAARWWKEKLGFRVVTNYPGWATVAPRGANVHIHLCPDAPPEKGNTGISFMVKDVAKMEKSLRRKGVKITMPTTKEEWGTSMMFADPDGNEFWISEG